MSLLLDLVILVHLSHRIVEADITMSPWSSFGARFSWLLFTKAWAWWLLWIRWPLVWKQTRWHMLLPRRRNMMIVCGTSWSWFFAACWCEEGDHIRYFYLLIFFVACTVMLFRKSLNSEFWVGKWFGTLRAARHHFPLWIVAPLVLPSPTLLYEPSDPSLECGRFHHRQRLCGRHIDLDPLWRGWHCPSLLIAHGWTSGSWSDVVPGWSV